MLKHINTLYFPSRIFVWLFQAAAVTIWIAENRRGEILELYIKIQNVKYIAQIENVYFELNM